MLLHLLMPLWCTSSNVLVSEHGSALGGGESQVGQTHRGRQREGDGEPGEAAGDEAPHSLQIPALPARTKYYQYARSPQKLSINCSYSYIAVPGEVWLPRRIASRPGRRTLCRSCRQCSRYRTQGRLKGEVSKQTLENFTAILMFNLFSIPQILLTYTIKFVTGMLYYVPTSIVATICSGM